MPTAVYLILEKDAHVKSATEDAVWWTFLIGIIGIALAFAIIMPFVWRKLTWRQRLSGLMLIFIV